jgi:Protein of unknown function (DUF2608)
MEFSVRHLGGALAKMAGLSKIAFLALAISSLSLSHTSQGVAFGQTASPLPQEIVSESIETANFEDLEKKALELVDLLGPENVLVAYDVDNTLLALNQQLGSNPWYSWQSAEMKKPQPNDAITMDKGEFARICSLLLAVSSMHTPQPEIPSIVARLQDRGIPSIILTSRRYDMRDSTLAVLSDNAINMNRTPIGPTQGFAGTYLPYDLNHPEEYGLTQEMVKSFALPKVRPVSYQNGMFMVDGLHKGAMLRTLLHKTGQSFKAILFIDDAPYNVRDVQAAFKDSGVAVFTYRYNREDQNVQDFNQSDKSEVKEAWKLFNETMKKLFPKAS